MIAATEEPALPQSEERLGDSLASDEAGWRLQLLADAGVLLSRSLEWKTTVTGVARLALGRFAEWTVVDYLDDGGRVKRLAVQHSDPAKAPLASEYSQFAPDGARPSGIWLALRTGRSQLVSHVPVPALEEAARQQRPVALAREMGHASFIVAPLVARERTLGALTFARGPGQPPYNDADLRFAEEIARRAALAVDNARLFRNARVAEEEIRRAATRLRLLADASQVFAEAHLDVPRVLDAVAETAARALSGEAAVLLADPQGTGQALPIALGGADAGVLPAAVQALREVGLAAMDQPWSELGTDALSAEALRECCTFLHAVPAGDLLVSPLLAQGRPFGGLAVWRPSPSRPFTCDDQALLEDLAGRAALSLENAHLYRQATESVNVRDSFLSIAGHELKTPLTALQLQVRCLSGETKKQPLEPRVAKVARQCDRLVSLVDELLDVSRITAGRLRLEVQELDLAEVARERVAGLADELGRADCEVRVVAPAPVVGRWDRLRVEQVVVNLLTNAMKYGCGKPIDLNLTNVQDRARLQVRDRGIGIAPEDQARIFARFERAVSSRHFGGLGLGLWIARQVVEAHGGTISVASTPGEGATFTVELPVNAKDVATR
ncbi:MAG TPA: ATP-binding protein [Myxococcales bacterium]|jgi:signal transduction histidine kinase